MQITGRAVLVFEITGSVSALGTVYFFSYIPQLLLSQFAGVFADRYDRRRLLMRVQFLAAIGALVLGVLADTGTATLLNVCAASFALGACQAVQAPTANALISALVPRSALASAVTIQSATGNVSRILGPTLAAAVIPLFGVEALFYGNALSFVVIIGAWAATPVETLVAPVRARTFPAIAEGFRTVRQSPDLWAPIVLLAVISGVGLVYQPLGVAFTTDDLAGGDSDQGASLFGLLQAALGVGAVVGILVTSSVARRRPADALLFSTIAFSVALILLGATTITWVVLVVAVVLGGCHFAQTTVAMNLVQHQVPEALRGRVMAIHMLAFVGTFPVTSWIAGVIADVVGVRQTMVGAGAVCLAFALYALRWRPHIRMDGPPDLIPPLGEHG